MTASQGLVDTVSTPAGKMHFIKKGSGYPLLLLHPLGTSTWAWHTVIDALSQHYTCYAFDMLGHGESDKPNRHFNIPDHAQALNHACQALDINRGHIVGNSVGAILAAETAASFPELCDRLVLIGCPVWDSFTAKQRLNETLSGYDDQGMPKTRTMREMKEGTTFAEPRQEWVDAMNGTRAQAGLWVGKSMESLAHYDVMSRLPRIRATATMVMYGEVDRLRDGEELLHNNIVNASKTVLPGLGHIPQIEGPEDFVGALLPFLQASA